MSDFICPLCGKSGYIVSVETIIEAFPCGPDGKGGIEYDGTNGKVRHTERSHFECRYCDSHFIEGDLLNMEVDA